MEKTIDECFSQIQNGANIKQGIKNGGFPITRIETISNDKFNRDKMGYAGITDASQYENYILEDNDLLMSHINSPQYLGRTVLYKKVENEIIIHGMNLLRLKANKEINPSYARYYFYGNKFRQQIVKITKKSVNQASFAVNDLKRIKMYLPEMESQNNIVRKLDIISKLIDFYNEILNKYDLLIKARFIEMFGEPVKNPKKFEKRSLKDTCKIVTGNTPSRAVEEYYGDFVEWIKTDNIISGEINPTRAVEYLSEEGMKVGRVVEEDAILMACIAGSIASIGRVCVTDRTVAFNQQINAIVPYDYNQLFLYVLLQISKDYLIEDVSMSLKGILSKSKLEEKEFIVPPIELQNQFADFVRQVDKSREEVKKSLEKTQQLYDSLMQEYFG